jgi:hypothetical protein
VIEAREPGGDHVDFGIEPVVGDDPADVSVLLRPRSIDVVGDEQDLERTTTPHQAREPGHRGTAGDDADADLELAGSVFSREANRMSQARMNSLPAPRPP